MKLMKISITIFLIYFQFIEIKGLFESTPQFIEYRKVEEIDSFIHGGDFLTGVYFYSNYDCDLCISSERVLEQLHDDLEGLVKFAHLDCDKAWEISSNREKLEVCNPKHIKELPQLVFYEPPKQKFHPKSKVAIPSSPHPYSGNVSVEHISAFASLIAPSYRTYINDSADFDNFLNDKLFPNKFVLFTNKNSTPPLFKGLTSYFRDRIDVNF